MSTVHETHDVIVVGGGPGGVVFSYLMARAGLKVLLLEAYRDFNRQFRGDTLNPLALGLLHDMGLMEEVLQLPHRKVDTLQLAFSGDEANAIDLTYSRMPSRYPYVMILSQPIFLNFMVGKASAYSGFTVRMQARVSQLIEDGGRVQGVHYKTADGIIHEARAQLVIGADGRNSVVREQAGLETVTVTKSPANVIWFKLPLKEGDPEEGLVGRDQIFMFKRPDEWQVSVSLDKRTDYKTWKERGIEAMRADIARAIPQFKERMEAIEWKDTSLLPVELKRVTRWYRDGLLLIGDAAHVMSPFGGIGINIAIRDAVMAANLLIKPLLENRLTVRDLKRVQDRLDWEIKVVQNLQAAVQDTEPAEDDSFGLPPIAQLMLKIPIIRDIPVFILSFGLVPIRVSRDLLRQSPRLASAVGD